MVDMTLDTSLQGKGHTALHMSEDILAFERNLTVLDRDLQKDTLTHFPNLREFKEAQIINSEYLQSAFIAMQTSFGKRFCEFRTHIILPCDSPEPRPLPDEYDCIAGVSQPALDMVLVVIADKDIWMSEVKRLTAHLENVTHQKNDLAQNHKWRDIENLPKPSKNVF